MAHRALLLIAAVAALIAAGCGSSGSTSSDRSPSGVRSTMRAYLDDLQSGHGSDACALMTDAAQAQTGQGSASACAGVLQIAQRVDGKALADYEARLGQLQITITGDRASAPGLDGTANLTYSGGRWLIDSNS